MKWEEISKNDENRIEFHCHTRSKVRRLLLKAISTLIDQKHHSTIKLRTNSREIPLWVLHRIITPHEPCIFRRGRTKFVKTQFPIRLSNLTGLIADSILIVSGSCRFRILCEPLLDAWVGGGIAIGTGICVRVGPGLLSVMMLMGMGVA